MLTESIINVLHHGPILCTSLLPSGPYLNLYASLVCGLPIANGFQQQLFLDSGLIHIMVVSGAHLIFLEKLMKGFPHGLRIGVLGLYCWLTGFGAPAVKAFMRRLIMPRACLNGWTGVQIEAFSVLMCLSIVPEWLLSRSFLMSWICSLSFTLPRLCRPPHLDHALKVYFLLFIFSPGSPVTILWNALVAPLVGQLLFPLSLATIPFPFLRVPADAVWSAFLWLIQIGPRQQPFVWFAPTTTLWCIPLSIHILILLGEVRWRRAFAFSS